MIHVVPIETAVSEPKKVQQFLKKDRNIYDSFKFIMVFAQSLGALPIENVLTSYSEMHFKWRSWKVYYTCFVIVNFSFIVLIWMAFSIKEDFSLKRLGK